jgi:DNA polymerase-1
MEIIAMTQDAYKLIHQGILAFARAERQGIRIDVEYCRKETERLTKRINHYQKKIEATNLFKRWSHIYRGKANINSNAQLSNLLYRHMKITPPKTTGSGVGGTDEEALKQLEVPGLDLILQIRKMFKIRDTYLGSFIREVNTDGYMRPSFNLHVVRTFRSSSANPNFQNIPKRNKEAMNICRRAILPRPGHMLMEADFSGLEVTVSEFYHKDPTMMKYLQDKSSDMHGDMAKQIFVLDKFDKKVPAYGRLRQAAKNSFVFPQFYGDYYGNNVLGLCEWTDLPKNKRWKGNEGIDLPDGTKLAAHLRSKGIKSFDDFTEHMKSVEDDFWNRRFKVYNQWKKGWVEQYRKKGHLQMYTGFVCSGVMRKNEIINYPVQGTAFHCLLKTFILVDKIMQEENWKSRLIGQIHDSLVMDVYPPELNHIKETLERIVKVELPKVWPWIIVPLEIEVDEYGANAPWVKTE